MMHIKLLEYIIASVSDIVTSGDTLRKMTDEINDFFEPLYQGKKIKDRSWGWSSDGSVCIVYVWSTDEPPKIADFELRFHIEDGYIDNNDINKKSSSPYDDYDRAMRGI